jgi:hypothetical protein
VYTVYITIVKVVDNDDDNEFVNGASFFSENPIFRVWILTL